MSLLANLVAQASDVTPGKGVYLEKGRFVLRVISASVFTGTQKGKPSFGQPQFAAVMEIVEASKDATISMTGTSMPAAAGTVVSVVFASTMGPELQGTMIKELFKATQVTDLSDEKLLVGRSLVALVAPRVTKTGKTVTNYKFDSVHEGAASSAVDAVADVPF